MSRGHQTHRFRRLTLLAAPVVAIAGLLALLPPWLSILCLATLTLGLGLGVASYRLHNTFVTVLSVAFLA